MVLFLYKLYLNKVSMEKTQKSKNDFFNPFMTEAVII